MQSSDANELGINSKSANEPLIQLSPTVVDDVPEQQKLSIADKPVLFVELCSGSGRLSMSMKIQRFMVLAVDHERNNHRQLLPTVKVDLSDPKQIMVLVDLIQSNQYTVVLWCAVPCGTCSRAREIPVHDSKYAPQPLRSAEFPRGLPNLEVHNTERVRLANSIYDNVWLLIQCNLEFNGLFVIENPMNSWLWSIDTYKELLQNSVVVDFQHCKWTIEMPMRPKWTRLVTNCLALQSLKGPCELEHKHLPWGKQNGIWATALEAEYPQAMCDAVVACFMEHFDRQPVPLQTTFSSAEPHKKRKVTAKQPRGKLLPSLMPEFSEVLTLPANETLSPMHKILRSALEKGEQGNEEIKHVVGVWRNPQQFVNDALELQHPMDSSGILHPHLCDAIQFVLENDQPTVAKHQLNMVRHLIKLAEDFKEEEKVAHSSLDPAAKEILKNKNLKLMQHLLHKMGWPDVRLIDDVMSGFFLTGHQPFSGVFLQEPKVANLTEKMLQDTSTISNKALMKRTKSSGDLVVDDKLWQSAVEESTAGWLTGPFYYEEDLIEPLSGNRPHLSRRFPLVQGEKIRAIDDLCESNVNASFAACEKVWFMDTDYISSSISQIERLLNTDLQGIIDSSGQLWKIIVDDTWNSSQQVLWKGRTIDLKAAYKQLHVNPGNRWSSCIVLYDPVKEKPAMFVQNTLPFGSASSVTAFNRFSRAIWALGCHYFKLIWWNFYDDFPIVAPVPLLKSNYNAALILFQVLGCAVSLDPNKTLDWAHVFSALGVTFDIERMPEAKSTISNTSKRTEKIIAELEDLMQHGRLNSKTAERLRGKLQFMDAQIFGRVGKGLLQIFSKPNFDRSRNRSALERDVQCLIDWLKHSKPRQLSPALDRRVVHVFTDGACEEQSNGSLLVTCGAVFIDPNTGLRQTFGCAVKGELVEEWILLTNKRQLVTEAELLPVLLSKRHWFNHLKHSKVIFWVDSEPAKFSLIRGMSDTITCNHIVQACNHLTVELQCNEWFSRVPSKSNPADDPSRLVFDKVTQELGLEVVEVAQPQTLANGRW